MVVFDSYLRMHPRGQSLQQEVPKLSRQALIAQPTTAEDAAKPRPQRETVREVLIALVGRGP